MSAVDLQPFCGGGTARPYLNTPFSLGKFSYATNGHVLVRVPRRSEFSEFSADVPMNVEGVLKSVGEVKYEVRAVALPPKPVIALVPCDECNGTGREHDCRSCECDCEGCGGKGQVAPDPSVSTTVCGLPVNLEYVRLILALPGIEWATSAVAKDRPIGFRFTGGVGCLMPMRGRYPTHIHVFGEDAAAASHASAQKD